MNRSVRRVMVGVAGLAVLGMTATLAGAQTDAVKEKPAVVRAAVGGNSLIGPTFASMTVNQTPQIDILRVNATYK